MATKYLANSPAPDELSPPKMSQEQESQLDAHFTRNKTIHPTDVSILAAETNLTEEEVQQWFLCRLAHWRKEQGLGPLVGRLYE